MILCPDAIFDDGLLDISLVGNVNFFEKLNILSRLKKGTHIKHKKVEQFNGKKVVLENVGDKTRPIHFMGEMYSEYP